MADTKQTNRGRMVYVRAAANGRVVKGKTSAKQGGVWADKIRMQAVEMVMAGKTSREVSADLGVPMTTIIEWRAQQWFKDTVKEIQEDDGHSLDHKITSIMHNSLDAITDRLANGDHHRDDKTGKIVRVPIKTRDATNAFNILMDKRQLIRKQPTKITDNATVHQQLAQLAQEFSKFVKKPKQELVIEGVHEFVEELEPEDNTP